MKLAISARVSSEEQKEGRTIESQLAELRKFAKQGGHEIVDEYVEDGWSGAVLERPELDRLRDDAKNGKFEAVLILHPDRLSRVQLHQLLLLDEFERRKIKVIFVNLPEFSEQSEESQVVNKSVWSMVSELERLRIRERTRRGRRNKAENKGLIVGNIPPYGYSYVKKDKDNKTEGYYKVNPEEARVVKMMFQWVKNGMSEREVVRKLTELKIPRRNPPKNSDKPAWVWAKSTIHKILTNETYTGITYYNKYESVEPENPINQNKYRRRPKGSRKLRPREEWIPIKLPPQLQLVSKEDFDFVQERLASNRTYASRNTKHEYLLRGLLKCKSCGSLYYANSYHGRPNYRCSNKIKHFPLPKTCQSGSISSQVIEPLVWNAVKEAIMKPELILEQAKMDDQKTTATYKTDEIKEPLSELEKEEARILEAYRQGIIEVDQLKEQIGQIKLRKKALEGQNKHIEKQPPLELVKKGVVWLCRQISSAMDKLNFKGKQQFLRLLIDEIIFEKEQVIIKGVLPVYDKIEPKWQITPTTFSCEGCREQEKPCWLGLCQEFCRT